MKLELKRILVPVDFSEGSRAAASAAIELAGRFGATVDLLHVWQIPPLRPDLMVWAESDGMTLADYARQNAEQEMRELTQAIKAEGAGEVHVELTPGDPASVIVERARANGYDLLVLGTHGRTGLAHMLIGSVAERVVRHAPCPVLTVRQTSKT